MQIEQSNVRKLKITDIYQSKGLDPIHVFLEDFEPRKGKITISCYDKSWHSYWGGMGDRTIAEFFLSCDNHYLAKNLSSINSSIDDYEKLGEIIKKHYKESYDDDDDDAFDVYEAVDSMSDDRDEWQAWIRVNSSVMCEVFGEDWWYDIPTMENPQYKYLCRIIDAVKEALREGKNS